MSDPILDTLFLPFADGEVALPEGGRVLFLRARLDDGLDLLPRETLTCVQSFRPDYNALSAAGFTVVDDIAKPSAFDLTLVLPHRQREENRALLARAVQATKPGGLVMAAQSNVLGARTLQDELEALAGNITSLSKNKCRVFWARIDQARIDVARATDWLAADAPCRNEAGYLSRPGLFAWDRIDAGSKLLATHLPRDLSGRAADLGTGFGFLADHLLNHCPGITHIDVLEAEKRALDLAQENLAPHGDKVACHWSNVTRGSGVTDSLDVVISNPPFHIDRADRNDLGQGFVRAASRALRSGGQFWMVANRHLPYEETLKACFKAVHTVVEDGQYKVFKAIGPKSAGARP